MHRILPAALIVTALASPASAAQIVALDVAAAGGVEPTLAEALTSVMLNELSRIEGMSVISQDDVRALLELEANKQALGCSEASCMTEIAGSLGAELMVSPSLSRVGRTYVASLVLIRVERANVARRAEGRAKGAEDVAAEAMTAAVHNLFKEGLPTELQGPASLSRRGFKAALAGLFAATTAKGGDPLPSRKRIILDLVNTELDYDAKPKMETLGLNIRRSIARLRDRALIASDLAELEHLLRGVEHYRATGDDLGRVKEIRERARERGVVPSSRPLRFEVPEPGERTKPEDRERYARASKSARKVVKKALAAYQKGKSAGFVAQWKSDYAGNAKRELESGKQSDERYGYTYELMPVGTLPPWLLKSGLDTLDGREEKMIVFMRKYRRGEIYGDARVWLVKEAGRWRISSW